MIMDPYQALEVLGLSWETENHVEDVEAAYEARLAEWSQTRAEAATDQESSDTEAAIARVEEARHVLISLAWTDADGVMESESTSPRAEAPIPDSLTHSMLADLPSAGESMLPPVPATLPESYVGLSESMLRDLPTGGESLMPDGLPPVPGSGGGLEIGSLLAQRYLIQGVLGSGGMGVVYAALDQLREQDVAIKVLRPNTLGHPQARQRFLNEAKVALSLSHPHIVKVYDIHEVDGLIFITMERLKGKSLREEIADCHSAGVQLPVGPIQRLVGEISDALQYAHQFTVHRDVKPENIWVREDGSAVLMDFGLARWNAPVNLTMSNAAMGTPLYMAPEQHGGARDVDGRADQYALALVAYELLCGQVPQGRFPSPQEVRKDIPDSYGEALMRALSADPAARFTSMDKFKEALNRKPGLLASPVFWIASPLGLLLAAGGLAYYFLMVVPDQKAAARLNEKKPQVESWGGVRESPSEGGAVSPVVKAEFGGLRVTTNPPGAEILIAGETARESPADFPKLAPGTYKVQVIKDRYQPQQMDLEVKSGEFLPYTFKLELLPQFGGVEDPAEYYKKILRKAEDARLTESSGMIKEASVQWDEVIDCLAYLQEKHPEWQKTLIADRMAEFERTRAKLGSF